ncbi:HIT-like domain-containing protein [Pelagophyceae sp. CCMP2097]|nr:HIT-like domain-containing protein [Pelagophyceae sp. CCMP2097]|mmetsp:Transcript_20787/g.71443  ORF Transcript_20787/g.71443 Transcript_20787/m.71443 type:complete len:395 (+) Transcript_20787:158-1342(+)
MKDRPRRRLARLGSAVVAKWRAVRARLWTPIEVAAAPTAAALPTLVAPVLPPLVGGPTLEGGDHVLARRSLADFELTEVLASCGGLHCRVLGAFRGAPHERALLTLDLRPPLPDALALMGALPRMRAALSDWSGAEFSFYDATYDSTDAPGAAALPSAAAASTYALQVHCPASARAVSRARQSRFEMHVETAAAYASVVRPYALELVAAGAHAWAAAVAETTPESSPRTLLAVESPGRGFVIAVDTKWKTHSPIAAGVPREAWRGAPWTADLHLLGVSRDAGLLTLRDLSGTAGADLVEAMHLALCAVALDVYGVPATQLRTFFHYQPQFYRLHAHCTRVEHAHSGCEAERAHLLVHVADLLRQCPDFYAEATLCYRLKCGDQLHQALAARKPR